MKTWKGLAFNDDEDICRGDCPECKSTGHEGGDAQAGACQVCEGEGSRLGHRCPECAGRVYRGPAEYRCSKCNGYGILFYSQYDRAQNDQMEPA